MESPIVSTQWLEDHLDDPKVRIFEISAQEDDETYRLGHIPGAIRWFWKDLCWHLTDREFLTPKAMATMLGEVGITPETTLVLYGDPVQYGERFAGCLISGLVLRRGCDFNRRESCRDIRS